MFTPLKRSVRCIYTTIKPGWWFGTCFFPYILEIIIPTDLTNMFQRGRLKPPTRSQHFFPTIIQVCLKTPSNLSRIWRFHLGPQWPPGEALKFYCDERLHGRVLHPSQGQDVRLGWGKVPRGKWSSLMVLVDVRYMWKMYNVYTCDFFEYIYIYIHYTYIYIHMNVYHVLVKSMCFVWGVSWVRDIIYMLTCSVKFSLILV